MKVQLAVFILMLVTVAKAQSVVPQRSGHLADTHIVGGNLQPYAGKVQKKWTISKYTALSASYQFFRGGSASVVSLPAGLQLNRRLNNHLFAFTGVSVAPSYITVNGAFMPADASKMPAGIGFMKNSSLAVYSKASLGLMYVNSEKTFSISGSIGIERSSSPFLYNNGTNLAPVASPFSANR